MFGPFPAASTGAEHRPLPTLSAPAHQRGTRRAQRGSSEAREQKGINHLAVIGGWLSTALPRGLSAPVVPPRAPLCCARSQLHHQPAVQAARRSPCRLLLLSSSPLPTPTGRRVAGVGMEIARLLLVPRCMGEHHGLLFFSQLWSGSRIAQVGITSLGLES